MDDSIGRTVDGTVACSEVVLASHDVAVGTINHAGRITHRIAHADDTLIVRDVQAAETVEGRIDSCGLIDTSRIGTTEEHRTVLNMIAYEVVDDILDLGLVVRGLDSQEITLR